jgi:hypothetical protein
VHIRVITVVHIFDETGLSTDLIAEIGMALEKDFHA